MINVKQRLDRLYSEWDNIKRLKRKSPFFDFREIDDFFLGQVPEKYLLTYTCKGIKAIDEDQKPIPSEHHELLVHLHSDFPIRIPEFEWKTEIWHPNIDHEAKYSLCIDELFWYASRDMYEVCLYIGEMIMYKKYHYENRKPFPLDSERAKAAAKWCPLAIERKYIPPPFHEGYDTREFLKNDSIKIIESSEPIIIKTKKEEVTIIQEDV